MANLDDQFEIVSLFKQTTDMDLFSFVLQYTNDVSVRNMHQSRICFLRYGKI